MEENKLQEKIGLIYKINKAMKSLESNEEYARVTAQLKELKAAKAEAVGEIKESENEALKQKYDIDGKTVSFVYNVTRKLVNTFDEAALKTDNPKLYKEYLKEEEKISKLLKITELKGK